MDVFEAYTEELLAIYSFNKGIEDDLKAKAKAAADEAAKEEEGQDADKKGKKKKGKELPT